MRRIRPMALPIAGWLLAALHCNFVHAEVRIEGQAANVRVEAHDATVADILAALGERFGLHYRGTPAGGAVTATLEGPLRRVVARVLDGHSYVIQNRGDGLEVILLGTGSPRAVVPPPIAPPTYPARIIRRNE